MHEVVKVLTVVSAFSFLIFMVGFGAKLFCSKQDAAPLNPIKLDIIVGSVRHTPTGRQIADDITKILEKRSDIKFQILFVGDFALPFYTSETSPDSLNGQVADPVLQSWSDLIKSADAFIIVSPEYNGGYPAPLKNALDSLYQEWNHKPVGFVGYSGGSTGGANSIKQLQEVAARLEMVPVATSVKIPSSWKAFDEHGNLVVDISQDLNLMVDELIKVKHK